MPADPHDTDRFIVVKDALGDPNIKDTVTGEVVARYLVTSETPNAWDRARSRAARLNREEVDA